MYTHILCVYLCLDLSLYNVSLSLYIYIYIYRTTTPGIRTETSRAARAADKANRPRYSSFISIHVNVSSKLVLERKQSPPLCVSARGALPGVPPW